MCTAELIGWDPATSHPHHPPHLGSDTRALWVSQDRRHIFVTSWFCVSFPLPIFVHICLSFSLASTVSILLSQSAQPCSGLNLCLSIIPPSTCPPSSPPYRISVQKFPPLWLVPLLSWLLLHNDLREKIIYFKLRNLYTSYVQLHKYLKDFTKGKKAFK